MSIACFRNPVSPPRSLATNRTKQSLAWPCQLTGGDCCLGLLRGVLFNKRAKHSEMVLVWSWASCSQPNQTLSSAQGLGEPWCTSMLFIIETANLVGGKGTRWKKLMSHNSKYRDVYILLLVYLRVLYYVQFLSSSRGFGISSH
jgi:hypothetical protein